MYLPPMYGEYAHVARGGQAVPNSQAHGRSSEAAALLISLQLEQDWRAFVSAS